MPKHTDPLHGITLKMMVEQLVVTYGWASLGQHIRINCFINDPSIASSLKFLRRTPWARQQVENLYKESQFPSTNIWPDAPPNSTKD